jgi:hypothetical protein
MNKYKRKLQREQYKLSHPLMRFRKISPHVATFIKDELSPGSIVSLDSFPWGLEN